MPHNVSLISTIAAGFGLALVFGYVAARVTVSYTHLTLPTIYSV